MKLILKKAIVGSAIVLLTNSFALAGSCPSSLGDIVETKRIQEAFNVLKEVPRTKGEFEPTEEFTQRRETALMSLPATVPISKPLVHEFGDVYLRYDADSQVFLVNPGAFGDPPHICCSSFPVKKAVQSSSEAKAMAGISNQEVLIEFQKETTGQYQASNALGASAMVTKYKEDYWGIYAGDRKSFEEKLPIAWYKWFGNPLFRIESPLSLAPALKKELRGVIYVSPKPPYTIEGAYLSKPTIQNKSERRMYAHYIVGSIDCFAVVDKTGKILAQQPF